MRTGDSSSVEGQAGLETFDPGPRIASEIEAQMAAHAKPGCERRLPLLRVSRRMGYCDTPQGLKSCGFSALPSPSYRL